MGTEGIDKQTNWKRMWWSRNEGHKKQPWQILYNIWRRYQDKTKVKVPWQL